MRLRVVSSEKLLIVEDNPDEAFMLRARLEAEKYDVLTASNGNDALQLVGGKLTDLVLLDAGLPDIDGFEVCRRIRAWEVEAYGHSPVLPVVMVTGRPAEDRVSALEAGVDDFLTKPVNHLELLARVRSLLRIKILHDQLEARNRLLYDALQRSVSAPVAQRILDDPEHYLRPGGERRMVSILFADLRGYSTIAEDLPPQQAIVVLNTYLSHMIEIIYRYKGTVNQLLGDGVMALFGAPISYGHDAWRAVQAALDMREESVKLEPPGLPHIRLSMGIGITTGEAVVGHIGSERRVDYTAVGAVANLASRFNDHAGPGQILITKETYDLVRDLVVVADAGTQSVRGHVGWMQAYSVLGRRQHPDSTASIRQQLR
jgi:class 3 adenylate cyclase